METVMRLTTLTLALASAAALSVPAYAHHSFAMFDNTKTVTWEGTVEKYDWTNPHTQIIVVVPASSKDQSLVGRWDIEGASPNIMMRQGWNKASFKPGDKITVVGHPLRDGGKGGSLYYALDKNGNKLYHDVNRNGGPAGGPAPAPAAPAG
jgi:hypothetical protein